MLSLGIDEVGRGCWAGPLVSAAVILNTPIDGLKDSKLLSKAQRESLAIIIKNFALAYGLGWVSSEEIDRLGLTTATRLSMIRAVNQISHRCDEIVIDGNFNYLSDYQNSKAIIDGDNLISAISAASVLAKVARDRFMREKISLLYPNYSFDKHVGYGTKLHRSELQKYGVCPIHRLSFKPVQLVALNPGP